MRLTTERLVVRDFTMDDLDGLHEILGDADVMRSLEAPFSRERTAAFLRDFCVDRQPPGAFAAENRADGALVGYILFKRLDDDIFEMGWIIHKACWRKGYAYEASAALADYGFGEMGLHKICAETIDPVKAGGLVGKLGFRHEGVQRAQTRDCDGDWADLHWYGLLAEEWPGVGGHDTKRGGIGHSGDL